MDELRQKGGFPGIRGRGRGGEHRSSRPGVRSQQPVSDGGAEVDSEGPTWASDGEVDDSVSLDWKRKGDAGYTRRFAYHLRMLTAVC